jgi:quercetin dioxygenase-like cupin family protein
MSDYTIKNLMDVENAVESGDMEVRMARKHLDSSELGVSYFRYPPDHHSTRGHRHEVQEEAYVVVGGSGRVKLGEETIELRRWDVVRVAPTVVRGFDAGPEGLELIAVGGAKPEGGDGTPVDDAWPEPD